MLQLANKQGCRVGPEVERGDQANFWGFGVEKKFKISDSRLLENVSFLRKKFYTYFFVYYIFTNCM